MKVGAHEIPQEAVTAVTLAIRSQGEPFAGSDVAAWFTHYGVPYFRDGVHVASEAANRLLQWERKAGYIRFRKGRWQVMRVGVEGWE